MYLVLLRIFKQVKMMSNSLSKKVKELRKRKGFSQEELAEKSGLSVRTIQRIENGESDPSGDSIKRISVALEVTPDELIDWKIKEDRSYLVIMSLSALSFLLFPLLGIIIPLIFWILKKDKLKDVDELGKRILNFQITWIVLFFSFYMLLFSSIYFHIMPPIYSLTLSIALPIFTLYGFNILMIAINTIRVYQNKTLWFKPALRILK